MTRRYELAPMLPEFDALADSCAGVPDEQLAAELGRRLAALGDRVLTAPPVPDADPAISGEENIDALTWVGFGDDGVVTVASERGVFTVRELEDLLIVDFGVGEVFWHVDVGELPIRQNPGALPGGLDSALGGLDPAVGGFDPALRNPVTSLVKDVGRRARREVKTRAGAVADIAETLAGIAQPIRVMVDLAGETEIDVCVTSDGEVLATREQAELRFEEAMQRLADAAGEIEQIDQDDVESYPEVGGLSPAPGRLIGSDKGGDGPDLQVGAAVGMAAGVAGAAAGRVVARRVRRPRQGSERSPATATATAQVSTPPAPVARYCSHCGVSLDGTARFCSSCGSPASSPADAAVPSGVETQAARPHPQAAVPTAAITGAPEPVPTTDPDPAPAASPARSEADLTPPPPPPPPPGPVVTQPTPAPAPAPAPTPTPKPAWRCTHTVPSGGVWVWTTPDPTISPTESLPAGVQLQFVEAKGSWWKVAGWNGWEGWVDGRLLVPAR